MATIESLSIEIQANATNAKQQIDALATSLTGLKTASQGITGLASVAKQLGAISASARQITASDGANINLLASSLKTLAAVPKLNVSGTTANQITQIGTAVNSLAAVDFTNLSMLAINLKPLEGLGKSQLSSFITQLGKIPAVMAGLNAADMDAFAAATQKLAVGLTPLATKMSQIAAGFAAFPARIQKLIIQNDKLTASNSKVTKSYGVLGTGISKTTFNFAMIAAVTRRLTSKVGDFVEQSNAYVENVNLFTVAMGQYADKAYEYGERVQDIMGIDIAEWIRYQGVLNQIATGYGIASEKAFTMSKVLTQLSYDMSSFFNIKIATAQEKIEASIAGQVRPLRELGYALEETSLKELAFELGLKQNVETMTRAQKAQLTFIAIMRQSKNVMGDMARTIITPANAMRILDQQTNQLTRALGNVFIPILMKVLPYIQAFVKVLTIAAQRLAQLLGFELPKIDYSGMQTGVDGIAEGAEDVESGIGGASKAAKELKKSLLGIDELNILGKEEAPSGSGGGGGAGALGGDLGIDLSQFDYDFLGGLDKQVDKIADDIMKFFDKWGSAIKTIAGLLAGLWALGKIMNFVEWVGKLWKLIKGLAITQAFLKGWNTFISGYKMWKALGAGPFESFAGGLKSIGYSMTPLQKVAGTLAAIAIEAAVVYSVVKNLALGNLNLWESLGILIPMLGLVGAALYAMSIPYAGLIMVIVGVVAALKGLYDAQQELLKANVIATFYDNQGVAIADLSSAVSSYMQTIASSKQSTIDAWEAIGSGKTKIAGISQEISNLATSLDSGISDIQSKAPALQSAFQELYDTSKNVLEQLGVIIIDSLSGSTGKALELIGVDVDAARSKMVGITIEAIKHLDNLKAENEKLFATWSKDGAGAAAALDSWIANSEEISRIMGVQQKSSQELSKSLEEISAAALTDINWGDPETALAQISEQFEDVKINADAAKESVKAAADANIASYEEVLRIGKERGTLTKEATTEIESLIAATKTLAEQEISEINNLVKGYVSTLETNLVTETVKQYETAMEGYNLLSWWEKAVSGGKEKYVQDAVSQYTTHIVTPVTEEVKKAFGAEFAGIDHKWAADTMKGMMDQLFQIDLSGTGYTFVGNVRTVVQNALRDADYTTLDEVLNMGKDLDTGLALGIDAGLSVVQDAMKRVATGSGGIVDTFKTEVESNSPSLVMAEQGKNLMTGIEKGINENSKLATKAMENVANSLLSVFERMGDKIKTFMDGMLSGFQSTMSSMNVNTSGTVSFTPMKTMKIERFASGGFPSRGDLFMANDPTPELVGSIGGRTAVANNSQIISGIEQGVYNAMVNAGGGNGGGDWTVQIITPDGEIKGTAVITAAERANRRSGRTIIPVDA